MTNASTGPMRLDYNDARDQIRSGDLLAVRSTHGGFAAITRWVTRSPYTHTAIALRLCGRLMMVETRGLAGIVPVSQMLDKDFDVVACPVATADVLKSAMDIMGKPVSYDLLDLLRIAARLRLGYHAPDQDDDSRVCSALSAEIYRRAGWQAANLPGIPAPCEVVAAAGPVVIEVREGG
ncbi:MAG: hypothetical protein V4772_25420 [Pseudomonadota bacterium]